MENIDEVLSHLDEVRKEKGIQICDIQAATGLSTGTIHAYLGRYEGKYSNQKTAEKLAKYIDPECIVPKIKVKCIFCGREYESDTNKDSFCSKECKRLRINQLSANYRKSYERFNIPVAKKKVPFKSLDEVMKEAEAAGMTYGKYVAMMEGK